MGSSARAVSVIILFLSNGALFANGEDDYHFGDCGGNGAMPPKGTRGTGDSPGKSKGKKGHDYVFAEGRVACFNGEKVSGYVELWNDERTDGNEQDTMANPGRCGPK